MLYNIVMLVSSHERYLITGVLDNCSVGIYTQTNCHKSSYTESLSSIETANSEVYLQCIVSTDTMP